MPDPNVHDPHTLIFDHAGILWFTHLVFSNGTSFRVELTGAELHVSRRKGGKPSTHPIKADELRALRRLQREQAPKSPFVFVSERSTPLTPDSFNWLVKRTGRKAKLPFQCHAHMLRHACGYKLAGDNRDTRTIQAYLGHADIKHTVRYTELSPKPFRDFWRD